jgi:ABC-type transport system involved in cytochrome bd biosynthesis fused ATPase/permease subunit
VLEQRGGLDAVIGQRASDLSAGERRRLALARLLAGGPDLYLLDEPTAGLDDESAALVLHALDATGAGVLVATHDDRVDGWARRRREIVGEVLD